MRAIAARAKARSRLIVWFIRCPQLAWLEYAMGTNDSNAMLVEHESLIETRPRDDFSMKLYQPIEPGESCYPYLCIEVVVEICQPNLHELNLQIQRGWTHFSAI